MVENELCCVKKLSLRSPRQLVYPTPGRAAEPPLPSGPINVVSYYGVTDVSQVNPDLVGTARLEGDS